MKILCCFGRFAYGDPARAESYEHANFVPALKNLGHEVVLFETFDRSRFRSFAELNHEFLETVDREQPDIVLCVLMGYELWQETLALARSGTRAVLINWGTDDSWKYEEFTRYVAPVFDIYATTSNNAMEKARRDGFDNFHLTQWAASSHRLAEPITSSKCKYAVSFVGAAYGNRRSWIEALRDEGIEVACFGHGWTSGAISTEAVADIVRNSIISLNFSDSNRLLRGVKLVYNRQIKARVFEVTGMGGLLMTELADDLAHYFLPGYEVEVFQSPDELVQKIRRMLNDPMHRNRVAVAGNARVRRDHTYEQRFRQLLQISTARYADIRQTPEVGIDWESFHKLASSHRCNIALRLLAKLLSVSCTIFWGRVRGPRAARRLVYELSWRIAGAYTYSASGWPGRMFYRES